MCFFCVCFFFFWGGGVIWDHSQRQDCGGKVWGCILRGSPVWLFQLCWAMLQREHLKLKLLQELDSVKYNAWYYEIQFCCLFVCLFVCLLLGMGRGPSRWTWPDPPSLHHKNVQISPSSLGDNSMAHLITSSVNVSKYCVVKDVVWRGVHCSVMLCPQTADLANAVASEEDKLKAMMSQAGEDWDPSQ